MAENFKQKACSCGFDLTRQASEVVGMLNGVHPLGQCPKCNKKLILDVDPVIEGGEEETPIEEIPTVEVPTEEKPPKRSHHKKVK